MAALQAIGVSKSYGRQTVLKDFELTLSSGEFAALMGPSGSGKTTFLNLAAGLVGADVGSLKIGGVDILGLGDRQATAFRREQLGVVFQDFNLLDGLSAEDNVLLPVRLGAFCGRRRRLAAARGRCRELLSRLGLEGLSGKKPPQLSGGERQRVAIARALINRPALVLADEPTGSLDVAAGREFCALLRSLNAAERCAMLVVTHDPQVAAAATTVHFLKDGAIAASYATEGDAERVSRLYLETYR